MYVVFHNVSHKNNFFNKGYINWIGEEKQSEFDIRHSPVRYPQKLLPPDPKDLNNK